LREAIYPVLELREEKPTFVKVEGGKIDFFLFFNPELGSLSVATTCTHLGSLKKKAKRRLILELNHKRSPLDIFALS
jgi:hypothetical protein